MSDELRIEGLHVTVDKEKILNGVSLTIAPGEVHAIMGPNGSGKSTLAYALMGHPSYEVTAGSVTYDGEDVLALDPHKRARLGLYLGFQYPAEVTGVSVSNFLRTAYKELHGKDLPVPLFHRQLKEPMDQLDISKEFLNRYLNEGFSGGEKKKVEVLQALVLEPKMAIFDEADSGLDVDALRLVADGINQLRENGTGVLMITHYQRILGHLEPDRVHVLVDGKIVKSGGPELAAEVEEKGYEELA